MLRTKMAAFGLLIGAALLLVAGGFFLRFEVSNLGVKEFAAAGSSAPWVKAQISEISAKPNATKLRWAFKYMSDEELEQALRTSPASFQAWAELSRRHLAARRYAKSAAAYQGAFQSAPYIEAHLYWMVAQGLEAWPDLSPEDQQAVLALVPHAYRMVPGKLAHLAKVDWRRDFLAQGLRNHPALQADLARRTTLNFDPAYNRSAPLP